MSESPKTNESAKCRVDEVEQIRQKHCCVPVGFSGLVSHLEKCLGSDLEVGRLLKLFGDQGQLNQASHKGHPIYLPAQHLAKVAMS